MYVIAGVQVHRIKKKLSPGKNSASSPSDAHKYHKTEINLYILGAIVTLPQAVAIIIILCTHSIHMSAILTGVLQFICRLCSMIMYTINPFCYLIFSHEMRRKVKQLYKIGAPESSSVVLRNESCTGTLSKVSSARTLLRNSTDFPDPADVSVQKPSSAQTVQIARLSSSHTPEQLIMTDSG